MLTITDQIKNVLQLITDTCTKYQVAPNRLKLLAVSKTHPTNSIQAAYAAGLTEFGESYIQESIDKINQLKSLNIIWHFIGPIQSNKTRLISENFNWVQSVDRLKILTRLNEQRPHHLPPLNICIQINYFNEPQKKGAHKSEIRPLLELAEQLPNITLRGFMAIPPKVDSFEQQIQQYKQIESCFNQHKKNFPQMDTLSIGMSNDLEAAVASGSTMVRIGTALFGARLKAE
jgi:pyridoxal phosphate enzyme (YggS family)